MRDAQPPVDTTTPFTVVKTFRYGARLIERDGIQIGLDGNNRVYWADTDGWALICDSLRARDGLFTEKWYPNSMHTTDEFFHGAIASPAA